MHFWSDSDDLESEKSRLVYGTDTGSIFIYDFPDRLIADRGPRKNDKVVDIPMDFINSKSSTGTLQKIKGHSDWVSKVRYYHSLKSIVSCSADPVDSLLIAAEDSYGRWNCSSISVPKGVSCFSYCSFTVSLVAGGRDRQLRIYNPRNLTSYCTVLDGHLAPIVDIKINSSNGQIISVSLDKEIKVWDLKNHQCLQTITDSGFHKPDNIITCIKFSQESGGSLIAASSMIRKYKLREKSFFQNNVKSHDFPVRNLLYCKEFHLVASGCNGGVLNVWVLLF